MHHGPSFADYWEPWLGGQGTVGAYVTGLSEAKRQLIEHHLRLAYLAGGGDGPRSFAATAWAVRGVKAGGARQERDKDRSQSCLPRPSA